MAKVFVGNFSFSVNDEQLKEFFSKAGTVVSAKVMTEGHGGRSRGFGFVDFQTAEDAQKAIAELDGNVWEGRVLKVSEDRSTRRPFESRGRQGGDGEDSGPRQPPIGYFRAQPLELSLRKRKKADPFTEDKTLIIDYKEPRLLSRFVSERGRILPRRMTGLSAQNQRLITKAIKRAQHLALMPVVRG